MNNNKSLPNVANRTQLAALYSVTLPVFNAWIDLNQELKEIFAPYRGKKQRSLPPVVVLKVFEVLGEP